MRRALVLAALIGACKSSPSASPAPTPAPVTPTRATAAAETAPAATAAAETAPPPALSERELSIRREHVNKLYDRQDFEGAIADAEAILTQAPDDVRMLRVATSAHCILGHVDRARAHWTRLPEHDQRQISTRCARYGVTLP